MKLTTPKSAANSLKATFDEYKGWIVLGVAAYILYCFRGFFTAIGNTASAGADAATADLRAKAEAVAAAATAKSKVTQTQAAVKASTGKAVTWTPAELATFEADAATLANMLGRGPLGMASLFKDKQGAFSLIKQKYSRLYLKNNKPYDLKTGKTQNAETATSAKRLANYKVLASFYKEASGGHDLVADFRYYVTGTDYTNYFKWIL
jgi:hypothetical protein